MSLLPERIMPLGPRLKASSRPMSRDKSDTLLLLFSCVLVIAPHTLHMPFWMSLACGAILLWRGWVTFRGLRMPPVWALAPVALSAFGLVYLQYHMIFGREPGVNLVVVLLTLKLLEMRAKRDLFVVVLVSFFVMLTNFFYSQSMGTAALMTLALIAILTTQLSFQYTGAVPSLWQRFKLGAKIFALAIPLMLVLFVLFPRIQGPLWSLPNDSSAGRTGLSDSMSPGLISDLSQSAELAFRVKFNDPQPPQGQLYWRALVLDFFDGTTWSRKQADPVRLKPLDQDSLHGKPVHYQITLEATGQRWLFALDVPVTLPGLDDNPAHFTRNMQIVAEHPIDTRLRYDTVSYTSYALDADGPLEFRARWLQLPPRSDPKAHEFAARLRAQSADDAAYIGKVLAYFHEQQFSYTLQPPALPGHWVDAFLFDTRAGFCEHYSGAFTVLMRAAGIPARVVTGYQGGELNPVDDYLVVAQSDAHAWSEVWLEGRGWVRVDPTAAVAPERIQQNLFSVVKRTGLAGLLSGSANRDSLFNKLRFDWSAVGNAWNQWVLDYDSGKQSSLLESAGFGKVDWTRLIALLGAAGSIVVGIMAIPLLGKRRQRDPANTVYDQLCSRMEKLGHARAIHEGPRSYGTRLAETPAFTAERKAALAGFFDLYETLQYRRDGQHDARHKLNRLKTLLNECT
jgi:transglutaminase-like putative cysteine protease